MTTIKTMNSIIKEYKEYADMANELKRQMELLKAQAIDMLNEAGIDEYLCDEGKVTYRETISKRLQSTELKKAYPDLYAAFTKPTSTMRFTCN